MARDDSEHRSRDPEERRRNERSSGSKPAAVARALRRGRSGYGVDSVRPHLRDALELKQLMRPHFPAVGTEGPDADDTSSDEQPSG